MKNVTDWVTVLSNFAKTRNKCDRRNDNVADWVSRTRMILTFSHLNSKKKLEDIIC